MKKNSSQWMSNLWLTQELIIPGFEKKIKKRSQHEHPLLTLQGLHKNWNFVLAWRMLLPLWAYVF